MSRLSLDRLSLNQITTENWSLEEAIEGCMHADISWISVWRHKMQELGLKESRKKLQESGLNVSSLCRGGMFPALEKKERMRRIEDNKRAIEEAAELGTKVLVLVCGPSPDKNIEQSRKWVQEGIEELIPYAKQYGITLGIEPLHPMYAADRSVVSTLGQANDIIQAFDSPHVGVVIDVFHVWWDPSLSQEIERAAGSIQGFHVSDWKVPMTDMFKGRAMMGDGVIDIPRIRKKVEHAGYTGPVEVEIINQEIWDQPEGLTLQTIKERSQTHV